MLGTTVRTGGRSCHRVYDDRYYTYQKDNWYSASSLNGPYVLVKSDEVPMAFRTVKKTYWVSYPSGWTYVTPAAVKVKTR
jgi:hypothetical protein